MNQNSADQTKAQLPEEVKIEKRWVTSTRVWMLLTLAVFFSRPGIKPAFTK